MSRMKFMNTEVDNLTMDEALDRIDELIQEDRSAYVVTPNVDHLVQWLFRITQDPKRMAKRYLVDDRKILGMAIKYRKVK